MDERMVLKILHEMGWAPRQGEAAVAAKVFGGREALAFYRRGLLSFEFWSQGRNVAASACWLPKTEEDVQRAAEYAEKLVGDSFYIRFLARGSQP